MDAYTKATILAKSPSDISNFKRKYITKLGDTTIVFDSPAFDLLVRYIQFLKSKSKKVQMTSRYYMRPDYVSYDYYGTTNLAFLIMYINNCSCALEFTKDVILVPEPDVVAHVLTKCKVPKEILPYELKQQI